VAQDVKRVKHRAWIILAAAIGINLTLGVNYSWSVIKKALVTDWHWTNVDASLPYTVYTTIFALVMVFAGRLQDKVGPRNRCHSRRYIRRYGLNFMRFYHYTFFYDIYIWAYRHWLGPLLFCKPCRLASNGFLLKKKE